MAEDTHHDHEQKPRWKKIEKLEEAIDKAIDDSFKKNSLSFMEVDFALLMIHEKISQQKIELYNLYIKEHDGEFPPKDAPERMYG